jgi:hypothetical protein
LVDDEDIIDLEDIGEEEEDDSLLSELLGD